MASENVCPSKLSDAPVNSEEVAWINSFLADAKREGMVDEETRIFKHRNLVYRICDVFGNSDDGVPAQTCRLMEEYISRLILQARCISDITLRQKYLTAKVHNRILVIVICCMQLAAKMNNSSSGFTNSDLRKKLNSWGHDYSEGLIFETESNIFSTLDYHIPLWTSQDMVQSLMYEVSQDNDDLETAVSLMHMTECNRRDIEHQLLSVAKELQKGDTSRVPSFHLAAGCVAAALKVNQRVVDPIPSLVSLVKVPASYIQCICDVVLKENVLAPKSGPQKQINLPSTDEDASTSNENL